MQISNFVMITKWQMRERMRKSDFEKLSQLNDVLFLIILIYRHDDCEMISLKKNVT